MSNVALSALARLKSFLYTDRNSIARDVWLAFGGSGGGVEGTTLVFQPGGVASPGVYTDWPDLYAALPAASSNGTRAPSVVQIDDSFVSPAVIPAGTYNVDSVRFVGTGNIAGDIGGAQLTIATGTTFAFGTPGGVCWFDNIEVTYQGTAPLFEVPDTAELNVYLSGGQIVCTSTGPFISSAGYGWLITKGPGALGDGTHAIIHAEGPDTAQVNVDAQVNMASNATSAAGGASGVIQSVLGSVVQATQAFSVSQAANRFIAPLSGTSAFNQPLVYQSSAAVDVAAGATLTSAQYVSPMVPLTGSLAASQVVTLPNSTGAVWFFDLTGVALGDFQLTFTTGSGTTAVVTAADLETGQTGVIIGVVASHVVSRFS
jgi:hypothetical protein